MWLGCEARTCPCVYFDALTKQKPRSILIIVTKCFRMPRSAEPLGLCILSYSQWIIPTWRMRSGGCHPHGRAPYRMRYFACSLMHTFTHSVHSLSSGILASIGRGIIKSIGVFRGSFTGSNSPRNVKTTLTYFTSYISDKICWPLGHIVCCGGDHDLSMALGAMISGPPRVWKRAVWMLLPQVNRSSGRRLVYSEL